MTLLRNRATKPKQPHKRYALALRVLFTLMLVSVPTIAMAQTDNGNSVRNLGTTIKGNQEQPKVLYIVPWKSATLGGEAIPYRPINSQASRVFRHLERSEHLRHLQFLEELQD